MYFLHRYTAKLQDALKVGLKKGVITGLGVGLLMFVMFGSYALAFWYGSKLIADGTKNSTSMKREEGEEDGVVVIM